VANTAVLFANRLAGQLADRVVAYTQDYASHSPFLSRYLDKLEVIPPPVEVGEVEPERLHAFRDRYLHGQGPVIGIAARLATEKGVEYLLAALPRILERFPEAQVLLAGQHENVLGEEEYRQALQPLLDRYHDHWAFLGVLPPGEMAAFYESCDVTVLPSVNSTESFGLVQIESMICGTPVVASNLPGVRQPTRRTGMGRVAPRRDPEGLAQAILDVLGSPEKYAGDPDQIRADFSPENTAAAYESLFMRLTDQEEGAG
jgi:glycosyltransferase involved in cell wall biosynthesis